jgi:hypothetical protein
MKKVTFRVPIKSDGSFDMDAQRDLAKEFVAVQEAVRGVAESLESVKNFKPRADLPKDAVDIGMQTGELKMPVFRRISKKDRLDTEIANKRLLEIAANPQSVIRGADLEKRLKRLES